MAESAPGHPTIIVDINALGPYVVSEHNPPESVEIPEKTKEAIQTFMAQQEQAGRGVVFFGGSTSRRDIIKTVQGFGVSVDDNHIVDGLESIYALLLSMYLENNPNDENADGFLKEDDFYRMWHECGGPSIDVEELLGKLIKQYNLGIEPIGSMNYETASNAVSNDGSSEGIVTWLRSALGKAVNPVIIKGRKYSTRKPDPFTSGVVIDVKGKPPKWITKGFCDMLYYLFEARTTNNGFDQMFSQAGGAVYQPNQKQYFQYVETPDEHINRFSFGLEPITRTMSWKFAKIC